MTRQLPCTAIFGLTLLAGVAAIALPNPQDFCYARGGWQELKVADAAVAKKLEPLMVAAAEEFVAKTGDNSTAAGSEGAYIPCPDDFSVKADIACIRDLMTALEGADYRFMFAVSCPEAQGSDALTLDAMVSVPPPPQVGGPPQPPVVEFVNAWFSS